MALSTQVTGTLITATIWNDVVNYANSVGAHKSGGQTIESFGSTAKEIGHYVGEIIIHVNSSDKGNSWLRCDGRTIGSASSGATARANADMLALYTELWTSFTNTYLVIQDSSGSPTTRGASAAADFSANKRMPLPDMRGRLVVGMDDPGIGAGNRITATWADNNGGTGGAENHTLTTTEMPSHNHAPSGSANFAVFNTSGVGIVGSPSSGITASATTANAGSGGAHNNLQPAIALNYFIYTGN